MLETRAIKISDALASLLGFAKKSGALIKGFEAVRRAAVSGKLQFLLIDDTLAENSRKKIVKLAERNELLLLVAGAEKTDNRIEFVTGYKVLGMQSGGLAKGFADKLKQEHQWR